MTLTSAPSDKLSAWSSSVSEAGQVTTITACASPGVTAEDLSGLEVSVVGIDDVFTSDVLPTANATCSGGLALSASVTLTKSGRHALDLLLNGEYLTTGSDVIEVPRSSWDPHRSLLAFAHTPTGFTAGESFYLVISPIEDQYGNPTTVADLNNITFALSNTNAVTSFSEPVLVSELNSASALRTNSLILKARIFTSESAATIIASYGNWTDEIVAEITPAAPMADSAVLSFSCGVSNECVANSEVTATLEFFDVYGNNETVHLQSELTAWFICGANVFHVASETFRPVDNGGRGSGGFVGVN